MSWISVDDRLPDICTDVLIYCGEIRIANLSWEFDHDSQSDFYIWQTLDTEFDFNQITHWQPLPQSPKEK